MLQCSDEQQVIVGCVLLEKKENTLYLGMLSVDPQMQASGIGKLLLQHGELFARDHCYDTVTITVISKALANFSFMEMKKEL